MSDQSLTKLRPLTVALCKAAPPGYTPDPRAPGLFLRVQVGKRATRRTWVFRHGRSQIKLGVFPECSPDDARSLAALERAKVARGLDPFREIRSPHVAAVIEDFKRHHTTRRKGRKPTDDPDIVRRLDRIDAAIGKRPIAKVSRAEIVNLLEPYADRPTEHRHMRALLRLLWNYAVRAELASQNMRNVAELISPIREPSRDKVQVGAKGLMRVVTTAARYATKNPDAGLCVQTIALMGCRPAEAMALRWDDVDLERGTVLWRDRKAGDSQRLPLPSALVATLAPIRAARPDDVYVFRGRGGGHLRDLRKPWVWIRQHAKLPATMRLYDLRGSVASLIANTAGTVVAQSVLGHIDQATTMKYYTAADDERRKAGIDLVQSAIVEAHEQHQLEQREATAATVRDIIRATELRRIRASMASVGLDTSVVDAEIEDLGGAED